MPELPEVELVARALDRLLRGRRIAQAKLLRAGLAPEPFSDDFTPDYLAAVLARTRRALKSVLLDQTKVTGLGNIYASEVLFLARTDPFAVASELPRRRVTRLHRAILDVLGEAIKHGSTMSVDPADIDASYFGGGYRGRWRVYGREGEPCPACSASVRRVSHAGRSTYFCPKCQRR